MDNQGNKMKEINFYKLHNCVGKVTVSPDTSEAIMGELKRADLKPHTFLVKKWRKK